MSTSIKSKKPIARCFDYEDGRETQIAYIDGYNFGDRLLEGVMFKCELLPDKHLEISVTPKSLSYFSKLNSKKWLSEAMEFAITNDIFYENESGTGEDICFKND